MFIIFNTLFVSYNAFLIYLFLRMTYSISFKMKHILIFIIAFSTINSPISYIFQYQNNLQSYLQTVKAIGLALVSVFMINKLLKVNYKKSIITFCLLILSLGIGDSLSGLVLKVLNINVSTYEFTHNLKLYIIVNILINIIATICILLTRMIRNILADIKNLKPLAIVLSIAFIMIASNIYIYFSFQSFSIIPFIITFIESFLCCFLVLWYIVHYRKQERFSVELDQQKFYNNSLDNTLYELRRYKHDFNNHLAVLTSMIQTDKLHDAKKYLGEVINFASRSENTSVYNIKNAGLFGIMSAKIELAKDMNIKLILNVIGSVTEIPGIRISDLCEIVGILLDNALEAASETNNKEVYIDIIKTDLNIKINIGNYCSVVPDMSKIKTKGYSTKGTGRGLGLNIIEGIISEYRNILLNTTFFDKEMKFEQRLYIEKRS